jgi:hypothetical protein
MVLAFPRYLAFDQHNHRSGKKVIKIEKQKPTAS